MTKVLISGASGLIGRALVPALAGEDVVRLVRGSAKNASDVSWDPLVPLSPTMVSGFDAVVHLAGESVVGRWTHSKKEGIRQSRVLGTRHLAAALAKCEVRPQVFICASAVGFYGDRGDEILGEKSAMGRGFLPEVCSEWEAACGDAVGAGIRTIHARIGLVLSGDGGALAKMLPPFKLGLGGRVGSGRQWWSWIHIDDIVGAILHVMGDASIVGAVNLVAPNAVRNVEFTQVLAEVLGRPAIIPVPEFALRLAFGRQAADEMLLASQRVQPGMLGSSGYAFRFRELRSALQNLVV